jgi:beta-glucanase (GH16 family)
LTICVYFDHTIRLVVFTFSIKNMRLTYLAAFFLLFLSCKKEKEPTMVIPGVAATPKVGTDWELVFDDNFERDLSKWKVWNSGAFNNELQLYRPQQVSITNGILTISAQREAVTGPTFPFDQTPKAFEYVSGRMETINQYGPTSADNESEYRFIAKIKLPKGNGMWPAFWSTSDPWPTNGEIDILEARGNAPTKYQSNIFYGPTANTPVTKNADTEKIHTIPVDFTEDFHTYELIWRAKSLEFKFDDVKIYTYTADSKNYIEQFFGRKHHLILNLAVGGVFFSDKNSANFANNGIMQIDWVRVYKR